MKKVLIIQKQITPYWSLLFNQLNNKYGNKLLVVYCQKVEEDRKWKITTLTHNYLLLKKSYFKINGHPIYINFDIVKIMLKHKPDVIITYGFNPVMIIACCYSLIKRIKHVVLTDSWLHTINSLSTAHKLIRQIVFKSSDCFICVGIKSKIFLESYGVLPEKIFTSRLVIDNSYYSMFLNVNKSYDIIFSAQLVNNKMPLFIVEVVNILNHKRKDLKLLIIGQGPLESEIIRKLDEYKINYYFPGFIQQEELPKYYASAKLLLFPSRNDVWGIVANEACAVGTPVITCEYTGAAGDLIIDGFNGYVLPLIENLWVDKINEILNNEDLYKKLSNNAIDHVQKYTVQIASNGFVDAIEHG